MRELLESLLWRVKLLAVCSDCLQYVDVTGYNRIT